MWQTWVRSLDPEDTLEKEMATHSSTLSWKIPWAEEPGRNEESFWKLGMTLNWQLQKNDDFLVTIARNELCQQPEWVRKWNLSRAFRKDCDPADAMSDIWPYRTVRLYICVILSHLCVAICECNDTKIIQPLTTSKLPIVIMWSVEKVDTLCNSTWPRI